MKLNLKCSQPQHTEAGRLLGRMYYGHFLEKSLARDEYSGYPHNGGEHSLYLHLNSAEDYEAFLGLVKDHFGTHPGVSEFVQSVQDAFLKRYGHQLH